MVQNIAGAAKAKQKIIERYGKDHWKRAGAKGGKVTGPKGFALNKKLAAEAGRKGGKVGRKTK